MIDIIKMSPPIYSRESRDYQVISRLYTAIFNYCRFFSDDMQVWDSDIDKKLSQLRASTLNFHTRHYWEAEVLNTATNCFKYLMKRKGTEEAIRMCMNILMRYKGIKSNIDINIEDNLIIIDLATQIATAGVIEDLLNAILPLGMTYRIRRYVIPDDFSTTMYESDEMSDIDDTIESSSIMIKEAYPSGTTSPKHYGNINVNMTHDNEISE